MINDIPTQTELAEYKNVVWQIEPTRDTKLEDMLKPEYWAHISFRFKAGDRIIAVPADRSYFVELYVLAKAKGWAKVVLMREVELIADTEDVPEVEGYSVKWAGRAKWRVLQGKQVLSTDHDEKESALKWLEEHKKEIA